MENITESQAIELLKKYIPDKKVFKIILNHSQLVKKAALKTAKGKDVDVKFIKIGALLHDIGRYKHPPGNKNAIKHGIDGAKILRKEGLEKYARVAERHIGIGIRKCDITKQKLPLPKKCFVPLTKEEKIITYADNLVFGSKIKTEKDVVERYSKELGEEYGERVKKFNEMVRKIK